MVNKKTVTVPGCLAPVDFYLWGPLLKLKQKPGPWEHTWHVPWMRHRRSLSKRSPSLDTENIEMFVEHWFQVAAKSYLKVTKVIFGKGSLKSPTSSLNGGGRVRYLQIWGSPPKVSRLHRRSSTPYQGWLLCWWCSYCAEWFIECDWCFRCDLVLLLLLLLGMGGVVKNIWK